MSFLVKAVSQRRFLICSVVFVLMAVGMRPVAKAAGDWLKKRPVRIREALARFDRTSLAGFRFVQDIGVGNAEAADTGEYIEWRFTPVAPDLASVGVAYLNVYYYTEDGQGKTLRIPLRPGTSIDQRSIRANVTSDGSAEQRHMCRLSVLRQWGVLRRSREGPRAPGTALDASRVLLEDRMHSARSRP